MIPKPKKKRSLSSLKKKAWSLFSEWTRRKSADRDGVASCVTCGKRDFWKNLQASHFIPGRRNSILFVEENCHVACYVCNVMRHGALEEYYPFMLKTYGQEKIDELKKLKNVNVKFSTEDLESFILIFQNRLGGLA